MSHTPGPWHPGHLGSDSSCQCKSVVAESYLGAVCTIHVDNGLSVGEGGNDAPPHEEAVANMHLIAAVPDLLASLKGMVSMYAELVESGDAGFWDAEKVPEVIAARNAISKAEGRQ